MGADGGGGVTISLGGSISNILALLPTHFLCAPNLKVFTRLLFKDVLVSVSGALRPPSKHYDVTSRNVEAVAISGLGWQA